MTQACYDRTTLGTGIVGWVYRYRPSRPRDKRGLATGLEIGVQLEGDWLQAPIQRPLQRYAPGSVHVLAPARPYHLRLEASGQWGTQVGFIVYPEEHWPAADAEAELRFVGPDRVADRRLREYCRALRRDASRGDPAEVVRAASAVLSDWVARTCAWERRDALARGRRALEAHFCSDLYLHHVADAAGMHPTTFSRRFARRYGTTPIRHRLGLRLNHAARLSWTDPDLTVPELARASGFEDVSYFHRCFKKQFGMTPRQYAERRRD